MLLAHQQAQLERLCSPFDAGGFGGAPEAETDDFSDIDCFLLAANERLTELIKMLPLLLEHPAEPIVCWERGWHPGFGYQYVFVYPGGHMIDYFINAPFTLTQSAMALRTRLLVDRSGHYTAFLTRLIGHPGLSAGAQHEAAWNELTVELVRIRKYASRSALCAIAHRLERLRLILFALERARTLGEPYNPHDADKHVDLESNAGKLVARTFAMPHPRALAIALDLLCEAIIVRLDSPETARSECQRSLQAVLLADIRRALAGTP
jgi:hypothetical protein